MDMISKTFHAGAQPVKGDRLFLQFPALPSQVGAARHAIADFLRHQGWRQDDTDDVMLAVGEAGNNAVCYGRGEGSAAMVSIVCTLLAPQRLQIDVRNQGTGFQADLDTLCRLPDNDATHGRGFALMQVLMDDVEVMRDGPQTVVRLTKSCTA